MATCLVSYVDKRGVRHSIEIQGAKTYFEAAAIAVSKFHEQECAPGETAKLEIEVRTSMYHTLPVKALINWLRGPNVLPNDHSVKARLRQWELGHNLRRDKPPRSG